LIGVQITMMFSAKPNYFERLRVVLVMAFHIGFAANDTNPAL